MYGFEFGPKSFKNAVEWCTNVEGEEKKKNLERAKNMKNVLDKEDPETNVMDMLSLIPLFEAATNARGIQLSESVDYDFQNLTRHPLYSKGRILAWQVY